MEKKVVFQAKDVVDDKTTPIIHQEICNFLINRIASLDIKNPDKIFAVKYRKFCDDFLRIVRGVSISEFGEIEYRYLGKSWTLSEIVNFAKDVVEINASRDRIVANGLKVSTAISTRPETDIVAEFANFVKASTPENEVEKVK